MTVSQFVSSSILSIWVFFSVSSLMYETISGYLISSPPFSQSPPAFLVQGLLMQCMSQGGSHYCFLFCEASAPIFWTIWSIKLCHTDIDYGTFVFRDFSAKQSIKTSFTLQFNQFLGDEKSHSPNGRVICDLHSPDTFDTRLGEWASTNVQPCCQC